MVDNLDFVDYWTTVRNLRIHYKSLGDGPALILLHGAGSDWHEWSENIAYLSHGFHVYIPDLPGFGLSQSPRMPIYLSEGVSFLKSFMERRSKN